MKIFLDDIRNPPDDSWTVCRTASKVVYSFITEDEPIEVMSLDHDLGENEPTGYDLLKFIEEHFANGIYFGMADTEFVIHSANPVGRKNMEAAIRSIDRFRNS